MLLKKNKKNLFAYLVKCCNHSVTFIEIQKSLSKIRIVRKLSDFYIFEIEGKESEQTRLYYFKLETLMLTKKDINCKCILAVPREKERGCNNNTVCSYIIFIRKILEHFQLIKEWNASEGSREGK